MNWEAIGAIGEVIGAVAVVVTLVYLAAQIRHNTMSNRNAALQTISTQNADWLSLITQDDDVARIYRAGQRDLSSLAGNDLLRYGMLMTQFCRVFDTQHHQHLNRALPDDIWESSVVSIRFVLRRKGARSWWSSFGNQFSGSFQRLVKELLDDSSSQ